MRVLSFLCLHDNGELRAMSATMVTLFIVAGVLVGVVVAVLAVLIMKHFEFPWVEAFLAPSADARTDVILSFTTSPERLPYIREVIEHLYHKQSVKVDRIELNLPHVFMRNNTEYDLSQVPYAGESFMVINRSDDLGPITKFVPTLEKYRDRPDTIIIVVDDDIIYPPNLIEELLKAAAEHPDHLVTTHCHNGYYATNGSLCDLLEGYMSYLLRPKLFGDLSDFRAYLNTTLQSKECFKGDDYVLSNYVKIRDIPVHKISVPELNRVVPLEHGLRSDALHRQVEVPERERYCGCYQDLRAASVPTPLRAFCSLSA